MTDEQKHTEEEQPEAAQADLEFSEEQAEEVEGGVTRGKFGADRDPQAFRAKY